MPARGSEDTPQDVLPTLQYDRPLEDVHATVQHTTAQPVKTSRRAQDEVKRLKAGQMGNDVKKDPIDWREDKGQVEQMWSIHLSSAADVNELVESWKGVADGILIFTGLFSATVAAFVLQSFEGLIPNSPNSAILGELAAQRSILSHALGVKELAIQPPLVLDARSPQSAVRLNILWLFSLCISVSCALCAIIIQQWARRLQRLCGQKLEGHHSPDRVARLRLRLISSVTRHRVPMLINAVTSLLHVAVFLFFAGLVEFFWPMNRTVALAILILQCTFGALYLFFTIFPLIDEVSVYQTPITAAIWKIIAAFTAALLYIKTFISYQMRHTTETSFWKGLDTAWSESSSRFLKEFKNAVEYSFAKDDVTAFTDAELTGLLTTFGLLRVKNVAEHHPSLNDFRAFLLGFCSLISSKRSDDTQIRKISKALHAASTTPNRSLFGTWESWLIVVLRNFRPDNDDISQLVALCMRVHWFMLLHYNCVEDSVFTRLDGWGFFEPHICQALEQLRQHPRSSVAFAARCFQACLAADLNPYRFHMNERLLWRFVSVPASINISSYDLPYSPGDRSLIIIMGLIHDATEMIQTRAKQLEDRRASHQLTDSDLEAQDEVQGDQIERAQVLSNTIEIMEAKLMNDPPYLPISNAFEAFCRKDQHNNKTLGIEPALNRILLCIGKPELPPLSVTSEGSADGDEDGESDRETDQPFNPVAAFQAVVRRVVETLPFTNEVDTSTRRRDGDASDDEKV